MRVCEKCEGTMLLDREVDMEAGMTLMVFLCINCGRRKQAEQTPILSFAPKNQPAPILRNQSQGQPS